MSTIPTLSSGSLPLIRRGSNARREAGSAISPRRIFRPIDPELHLDLSLPLVSELPPSDVEEPVPSGFMSSSWVPMVSKSSESELDSDPTAFSEFLLSTATRRISAQALQVPRRLSNPLAIPRHSSNSGLELPPLSSHSAPASPNFTRARSHSKTSCQLSNSLSSFDASCSDMASSSMSQDDMANSMDSFRKPINLDSILEVFLTSFIHGHISFLKEELNAFFAASQIFITNLALLAYLFKKIEVHTTSADSIVGANDDDNDVIPPFHNNQKARAFYVFVLQHWLSVDSRPMIRQECLVLLEQHMTHLSSEEVLELSWLCGNETKVLSCDKIFNLDDRRIIQMAFSALSSRHAAQYLAAAHNELIRNIEPHDILNQNKTRNNPHCMRAIDHFNNCITWITSMILRSTSPKKRAKTICKWIDIATYAHEVRLLSVLQIIASALDHICVSRLKQTWSHVDQPHKDQLRLFLEVCSPLKNFRVLRSLADPSHPLPLSLVLKDVLFSLEAVPLIAIQPDEPFDYARYRKVGIILQSCSTIGSESPFSSSVIKPISNLQEFLLNPLPRYSESKLYDLSRLHEPSPMSPRSGIDDSPSKLTRAVSGKFSKKNEALKQQANSELLRMHSRTITESSGPAVIPAPVPVSQEVRVENGLLRLVKEKQLLQQSLLPTQSPPSSPTPSRRGIKAALGRFLLQ